MTISLRGVTIARSATSAAVAVRPVPVVSAVPARLPGGAVAASGSVRVEPPPPALAPATQREAPSSAVATVAPESVVADEPELATEPFVLEATEEALMLGAELEPFVFVVWLPGRGSTPVSSAPFASTVHGRHDRVAQALESGALARWDDPFSPWFAVWWSIARDSLSTVPRLAYAAQQAGLP